MDRTVGGGMVSETISYQEMKLDGGWLMVKPVREFFREYLAERYEYWSEEALIYRKG